MTVIPAEVGIQKLEVAKNNGFPLPDQVEDRLRGNDESLIRYFIHDTTLGLYEGGACFLFWNIWPLDGLAFVVSQSVFIFSFTLNVIVGH